MKSSGRLCTLAGRKPDTTTAIVLLTTRWRPPQLSRASDNTVHNWFIRLRPRVTEVYCTLDGDSSDFIVRPRCDVIYPQPPTPSPHQHIAHVTVSYGSHDVNHHRRPQLSPRGAFTTSRRKLTSLHLKLCGLLLRCCLKRLVCWPYNFFTSWVQTNENNH